MKNIKKLLAVLLILALCVASFAGCGAAPTATVPTLESSALPEESDGSIDQSVNTDPTQFEYNVKGLCNFMEKEHCVIGERVQMEFAVIGAVNGYKYNYTYNESAVQVEFYEFDPENLTDTAKAYIEEAKGNKITVLDKIVPAQLSADERFILLYSDGKAANDALNSAHLGHILNALEVFCGQQN